MNSDHSAVPDCRSFAFPISPPAAYAAGLLSPYAATTRPRRADRVHSAALRETAPAVPASHSMISSPVRARLCVAIAVFSAQLSPIVITLGDGTLLSPYRARRLGCRMRWPTLLALRGHR